MIVIGGVRSRDALDWLTRVKTNMPSTEFKHESLQDSESIADYLRALLTAIEAGHLELTDDDGQLVLHPSGLLGLELRARRRGSQARLVLELSWTEHVGKSAGLRIHSEGSDADG
jgi:amphi-Trp domain-containing protein